MPDGMAPPRAFQKKVVDAIDAVMERVEDLSRLLNEYGYVTPTNRCRDRKGRAGRASRSRTRGGGIMLICNECATGDTESPDARFEGTLREYVRHELVVNDQDEPVHDEGIISEPLGDGRTYRCHSFASEGYDVVWRSR